MTNFKDGYQVFNATNENTLNEIINKVKELFIKNFGINDIKKGRSSNLPVDILLCH